MVEGGIEEELVDEIVRDSERFYDPRAEYPELPPQVVRLLKQGLEQEHSCRVQDACWVSPAVRRLATHPRVLELLRLLYQRRPIPFQTLSFPVGSEQEVHADTMHFDTVPSGFMCGVCVALQDVRADEGPLVYYPGSHRLPAVRIGHWAEDRAVAAGASYDTYAEYVRAVVVAGELQPRTLEVKKGTLLVWAANLLHGGTRITRPGASRHSQVTHYFFEDCAYYTPVLSNSLIGEYRLRSVWDLGREIHVAHRLAGQELLVTGPADGLQHLNLATRHAQAELRSDARP